MAAIEKPHSYPAKISVERQGKTYNAAWHKASGRYRLRVAGKKEWPLGSDPNIARELLQAGIDDYLFDPGKNDKEARKRAQIQRPDTVQVSTAMGPVTLRKYKSGYRTAKYFGSYRYFSKDPEQAAEELRHAILYLVHPELEPSEEVGDEPNCNTLEGCLKRHLVMQEQHSVGRYKAAQSTVNCILAECPGNLKRLPMDQVSQRQWSNLQQRIKARHRARATRKEDFRTMQAAFEIFERAAGVKMLNTMGLFRPEHAKEGRLLVEIPNRLFTAQEVLALLEQADPQWQAMILWGINGAFEPLDLSYLRWDMIDQEESWFEGQRLKTGKKRVFKLWPETLEATRSSRKPGHSLVFPNPSGKSWKTRENNSSTFSTAFNRIQKAAGIYKPGRGFYALRHVFQHHADKSFYQAKDRAINWVMGHTYGLDFIYNPERDNSHIEMICEFNRQLLFRGEEAAHKFIQRWLMSGGDCGVAREAFSLRRSA